MTSSKWLILAATLAIVLPVAQAQTAATPPALVTERTLLFSAAHEAAMGGPGAMPQGRVQSDGDR
jgi:hypothetical protein